MTIFTNPRPRFELPDGIALNTAGKLRFREPGSGSTTLKDVYSSPYVNSSTAKLTNPVILSDTGLLTQSIWLNGDYNVTLEDSSGVTIWQEDNINPASVGPADTWNPTFSYSIDNIAYYNGAYYISLTNDNTNNTPSSTSTSWSQLSMIEVYNSLKTYSSGDSVIFDGEVYRSLQNSNTGNISDNTYWAPGVDLNYLTTTTSDSDADVFPVLNSTGGNFKIAKGNINLSGFNDDISEFRYLAVNEDRVSETAFLNVPGMTDISLSTGTFYEYEGVFTFDSSSATPDAKLKLQIDSGIPGFRHEVMIGADTNGVVTGNSGATVSGYVLPLDGTNKNSVILRGVVTPSSDIVMAVRFAQNTSNATATTMEAGSYIRFKVIG